MPAFDGAPAGDDPLLNSACGRSIQPNLHSGLLPCATIAWRHSSDTSSCALDLQSMAASPALKLMNEWAALLEQRKVTEEELRKQMDETFLAESGCSRDEFCQEMVSVLEVGSLLPEEAKLCAMERDTG